MAPRVQTRQHMKAPTDVLEILEAQHTEVDELIEALEKASGDRNATFTKLADLIAAHATVEERVFYPAIMRKETAEILHESVEEHLAIKRVLADMLLLDPSADKVEFDAKLKVLGEELDHHAHEEEEGKLFKLVRKHFDDDEREEIGSEALAMFEELLEGDPRMNVSDETGEAARL